MKAVIVGVGDELLSGLVVNSNAAMIGDLLQPLGIPVVWSMCIGDSEDAIAGVLRRACDDAEVVIVTGGLGPTHDDRTREALARLTGVALERRPDLEAWLRERFGRLGREMPVSNLRQAELPEGADPIPNPVGTAPGARMEVSDAVVYAIPGVPQEARAMLHETILPELVARPETAGAIRTREVLTCGIPEAELGERFSDLADRDNPTLAFLPGGAVVRLRFIATGDDPDACERLLEGSERAVRDRLGDAVFGVGDVTLEGVVGGLLLERGATVATAESCTAGMVAARLANVPGASDWLRGGLVTYQTAVKASELKVSAPPVSEDAARQMASEVRERLDADYGVAVTCVAGPDPQDDVDVGVTCLAVADAEGVDVRRFSLPGDRDQIRRFATTLAVNLLRLRLVR